MRQVAASFSERCYKQINISLHLSVTGGKFGACGSAIKGRTTYNPRIQRQNLSPKTGSILVSMKDFSARNETL